MNIMPYPVPNITKVLSRFRLDLLQVFRHKRVTLIGHPGSTLIYLPDKSMSGGSFWP